MPETITKTRRLPTRGEVYVSEGDMVQPETVIARATVPNPDLVELKLFSLLKVDPEFVKNYLTKHEGDTVTRDEVLGVSRSFFTRQTRVARSPIDGRIEVISSTTGRMIIRGSPLSMEVNAYIPGSVKDVIPGNDVVFLGSLGRQTITGDHMAKWGKTISMPSKLKKMRFTRTKLLRF